MWTSLGRCCITNLRCSTEIVESLRVCPCLSRNTLKQQGMKCSASSMGRFEKNNFKKLAISHTRGGGLQSVWTFTPFFSTWRLPKITQMMLGGGQKFLPLKCIFRPFAKKLMENFQFLIFSFNFFFFWNLPYLRLPRLGCHHHQELCKLNGSVSIFIKLCKLSIRSSASM